jgi:hypothetical protein
MARVLQHHSARLESVIVYRVSSPIATTRKTAPRHIRTFCIPVLASPEISATENGAKSH